MGLRTASVRRPHVAVMAPALTETSQTQTFKLVPKAVTAHLEPASLINYDDDDETNSKYPKKSTTILSKCVFDSKQLKQCASDLLKNGQRSSHQPKDPIIMSNNLTLLGGDDQNSTMGLQKNDSVSDLTSNNDLLQPNDLTSQNVDDIMQVIKSIEDDDFLNVLDMPIPDELDTINLKESQAKEMQAELSKKHFKNARRLDFLLRRLNKMRAKLLGHHISNEVAGVFEQVHRSLKRAKESQSDSMVKSDEMPMKPATYSSMKTLSRKLETTVILQANSANRQRHVPKYFGTGTVETPTFRSNVHGMMSVPMWTVEMKNEVQKMAGMLKTELSVVQKELDSEATDSSSGGESCDEMQKYSNPHQQYLSIQKRALWKYSTDRAAIAARWTWLQSQISDLEYRIRQHTDLHKRIRTSKGTVQLGGMNPPEPSTLSSSTADVPTSPTAVNGYRGQLPGNSLLTNLKSPPSCESDSGVTINCISGIDSSSSVNNGTYPNYQCARTRPLVNFRKRKLLQVAGLHAVSKKAARPSQVRCRCAPPSVASCALCTGRTDPTYPRDPPETLSRAERISMLDPGFHPVFSLPEDTSETIHYEAIMKTSDWQQRSSRVKTVKLISSSSTKPDKTSSLEHRAKKLEHRKKYGRLLKPSTMSALSAKIKNKFRGRKAGRHLSSSAGGSSSSTTASLNNRMNRKRHTAKVAIAQLQALAAEDEEVEAIGNSSGVVGGVSGGTGQGNAAARSPNSSPLLQMQAISGYNRKNRINSYDIDNIVIPYSVAAATRVEKLQYKEILTPKWRIADPEFAIKYETKNNGAVKNPSQQDSDTEDLSEESVVARHDRCEYDEKKKFLSYLKLPIGYGRARSHKRTDSRAESSGANTPDPMSPHPMEHQENNNNASNTSPLTSPPATPLSVHMDGEVTMAIGTVNSSTSSSNSSGSGVVSTASTAMMVTTTSTTTTTSSGVPMLPSISVLRRRTISQSRFAKDRERDVKEDVRCMSPEAVEIPPYDRRLFPLTEDTFDKMLKHMPENHHLQTNARAQDSSNDLDDTDAFLDDKLDSPDSESTESALGDEDPNDPEWIEMERPNRDRHKR